MQSDSLHVQIECLAVDSKSIDAFAIAGKIARGIVAEVADIELGIAIQDRLELTGEFRATREALVLRHVTEVQISPRESVILRVRRFEKCNDGALRRIAAQRVFILREGANARE